jgi:ribonucleoside-diphosphate reductase alpha chain
MSLSIQVCKRSQNLENYQVNKLHKTFQKVLKDRISLIDQDLLTLEVEKQLSDKISTSQINEVLILTATSLIEKDPIYGDLAAGLLLRKILREVFSQKIKNHNFVETYQQVFIDNLRKMKEENIIDLRLLEFDLEKLSQVLVPERDNLFNYLGLETIYSRYFLRKDKEVLETPQAFWMRIAMGLALNEEKKEQKAIEFYQTMSVFRFIPSTPTLFHSGLKKDLAQLSSCFLTSIEGGLEQVYKTRFDTAKLLLYSGGVSND